jgi:hypothetical protein
MEEEDHIHSTQLTALYAALAAAAMAARLLPLQLSLSLFILTFSLSTLSLILLSHNASIYRHFMATFSSTCQLWWDKQALKYATNCGMNGATTKYSTKHSGGWDICHNNDNLLTITPFAICMGNCPLASSAQACILHLFQASILRASSTQHSHSSVSTMLGPE